MKTYESPVYPALWLRLPKSGSTVKATGGYFNVNDADVAEFEEIVAKRPHYKVKAADAAEPVAGEHETTPTDHGTVTQPEPMTDVERRPEGAKIEQLEQLKVPELQARLEAMGLSTEGKKAALIQRLAEATGAPVATGDGVSAQPEADDTDGDATEVE